MSLNKKIENAQNKCSVYMSKAYSCAPPSEKIGKYTYRFDKVLLDAKHHLKVGKCDEAEPVYPYRRRRETDEELETEFAALISEMSEGFQGKNQYGAMASSGQLNKLEGLCRKFVNAALNDDSLDECKKLGAWKNRANQLLDDLRLMKNVCIKQAEEAANGGGGGGDSGGAYPKPTNAPKPPATKPEAYKPPKPSKKPNKP